MTPFRLLAPAAFLFAVAPAWAEVCIDRAAGQYASNHKVCASSVLKPQGGNTYGPGNLFRDGAAAWCEGAPGSGKGEYIRILYASPVSFKSILIGNGYAKSKATFFANARARTVRIETADGLTFAAELKDTEQMQTIRLPRAVKTATLRVEIVDVYGGDKHQDMCLHFVQPSFEEMDRENQ
jgi:hypothetical protein